MSMNFDHIINVFNGLIKTQQTFNLMMTIKAKKRSILKNNLRNGSYYK